jgi:hypothetical protein
MWYDNNAIALILFINDINELRDKAIIAWHKHCIIKVYAKKYFSTIVACVDR